MLNRSLSACIFCYGVAIKSVSYGYDYDKVLDKTTLVIYNK